MGEIKSGISIFLDKERHLKMTFGALIAFKEKTGKDLRKKEDFELFFKTDDLKEYCILIWALLRHEDKTLTIEQVEDLLYIGNASDVRQKLFELWGVSKEQKEAPLASPPTG